jgi:hypothetical protein
MSESHWLTLSGLLVGGAVMAWRWARSHEFFGKRRALGMARTEIGKAPEGPVRIQGVASCDRPPLLAPFSGRPCIFYDVLVESIEDAAADLRELRGLELTLDDGTGTARVVFSDTGTDIPLRAGPRDVTCVIQRAVLVDGVPTEAQAARIDARVAAHGLGKRGSVAATGRHWRVSEGIIVAGDVVSVAGRGSREIAATGVSADYRTPPYQYLIRASEQTPVTIVKM